MNFINLNMFAFLKELAFLWLNQGLGQATYMYTQKSDDSMLSKIDWFHALRCSYWVLCKDRNLAAYLSLWIAMNFWHTKIFYVILKTPGLMLPLKLWKENLLLSLEKGLQK